MEVTAVTLAGQFVALRTLDDLCDGPAVVVSEDFRQPAEVG